mmetsp:Transcript_9362/g.8269  ORF Transcript_9362/g.8269 Transcript_9362/m.8269 type:complete len:87 (+) Transcript_9362:83-343(+)
MKAIEITKDSKKSRFTPKIKHVLKRKNLTIREGFKKKRRIKSPDILRINSPNIGRFSRNIRMDRFSVMSHRLNKTAFSPIPIKNQK